VYVRGIFHCHAADDDIASERQTNTRGSLVKSLRVYGNKG